MMAANADDNLQLPHVTVYGTATAEVIPDQMIWSLKAKNQGLVLENVAKEHMKIVKDLLRLLRDNKVNEKTIQTSRMEFGENWEYRSSTRVREGYFASTQISFKITDLDLYSKLWLEMAKMPAASVENVAFDHTKRIDYQNETRQRAILAAREKAVLMAKAVGAEIGEALLVEEDLSIETPWLVNSVNNNLRALPDGEPARAEGVAPGTIPIRIRVRAAFRLLANPK